MTTRALALLLSLVAPALPLAAQTDGSVDPDFGGGDGLVSRATIAPMALAALAGGSERLFAVGSQGFAGSTHLHWWAVDRHGVSDPVRWCEGTTATVLPGSFGVTSQLAAAVVDRAGRLVVGGSMTVAGTEQQDRALLVRFDVAPSGCVPDASFTGNGWEVYDDESFCLSADCEVLDLVELVPASGAVTSTRYVALVRAASGGLGASRHFLLRLTESGAPDTTFSGDGWAEVDHATFGSPLYPEAALAVDASGRLYVLVTHADAGSSLDLDVSILRYAPNGLLDAGFGTAGRMPVSGGEEVDLEDARARDLVVAPDGSLFASIQPSGFPGTDSGVWGKKAGSPESALYYLFDAGPGHLALQSDRRLVVARDVDASMPDETLVTRFDLDFPGALSWAQQDHSWGGTGITGYDVDLGGNDADTVTAVTVWQGRPVFGGNASTPNWTGSYLLRARNANLFAEGSEGGKLSVWSAVRGLPGSP